MFEMSELNLPYHQSETCFRKYELTICAAVNRFPEIVKVKASDMGVAPVTFAARLRDAMLSYGRHRWASQISRKRYDELRTRLAVVQRGNLVLIGDKAQLKQITDEPKPEIAFVIGEEVTIELKTNEQKILICELATNQCFSKRLKLWGLNLNDVEYFEKHYDVAFKQLSDGSHTIL